MKKHFTNFLIILLIFLLTSIATLFSFATVLGAFVEGLGISKGMGLLISYILMFAISWAGIRIFKLRIGLRGILIPMLLVLVAFIILNSLGTTIKYSIKLSPFYLAWISGLFAGYFYTSGRPGKLLPQAILLIFPVLMSFGVYGKWIHKIEYGNWTGEVAAKNSIPYSFEGKSGEIVDNESLKGKIVLFDLWYIGCGPCWVKFPELQRIYEKYQGNLLVKIYAVNRPMKRDKPGALFTRIEDKNYTFPVLRGTQQAMDSLGIYVYPTVIVQNRAGEVVFMGELDEAERTIESLLAQNP